MDMKSEEKGHVVVVVDCVGPIEVDVVAAPNKAVVDRLGWTHAVDTVDVTDRGRPSPPMASRGTDPNLKDVLIQEFRLLCENSGHRFPWIGEEPAVFGALPLAMCQGESDCNLDN